MRAANPTVGARVGSRCGRVVHGFAAATTYSGGDFRFTFHEMEPRPCLGPCLGPWPTRADPPRFGAAGHAPPRGKLCFVAALGRSSIPHPSPALPAQTGGSGKSVRAALRRWRGRRGHHYSSCCLCRLGATPPISFEVHVTAVHVP